MIDESIVGKMPTLKLFSTLNVSQKSVAPNSTKTLSFDKVNSSEFDLNLRGCRQHL